MASSVGAILNVSQYAVAAIIEQDNDDGNLFLHSRSQLTDIHLKAAIAHHHDYLPLRSPHFCAQPHLQALSDSAARCVNILARPVQRKETRSPGSNRDRDISYQQGIPLHAGPQLITQLSVWPEGGSQRIAACIPGCSHLR